jgi:hypothetical protein
MTDKAFQAFQAWKRSAARVTLHPAWPIPIELNVVRMGLMHVMLQCIVHAYNASDVLVDLPLVPWTNLPMIDILFSQTVPDIDTLDTPVCEVARLRHVRERLHKAALHELDEFLLVDGCVAASPHEISQPASLPTPPVKPPVKSDEISTWRAAIARISLHPASRLQIDLDADENLWRCPTISCTVRSLGSNLTETVRNTADARVNTLHVQQLLALVRHSVQRLLDECLIVDGIPTSPISVLTHGQRH